jgi:uncharacterized Rmd1/YagE family protein
MTCQPFASQVKIGISYALAQSTKLSIFEERMTTLTDQAVELPKMLAATGVYARAARAVSRPSLAHPTFSPAAAA